MVLEGGMTDGDLSLMVRCQIEDMLLFGTPPREILAMASRPQFQGLFAAKRTLGEKAFLRIFDEVLGRIGVHRTTCREEPPLQYPESFIPVSTIPTASQKESDHA